MSPLTILDNFQQFYKEKIFPNVPPEAVTAVIFVVAVVNLYLLYNKSRIGKKSSRGAPAKSGRSGGSGKRGGSQSQEVKDIFSALRRRKKSADDGAAGKKAHSDKPFGSSYYYAHNNPTATGGYKDGLRMEDYMMNKPRLLAKGGKPVDEDPAEAGGVSSEGEGKERTDGITADSTESRRSELGEGASTTNDGVYISPTSVPISRYMWDDDAGDNVSGVSHVAKIYIDSLPSRLSTGRPIKWDQAGITKSDVNVELYGEGSGLLIRIRRPTGKEGEPAEYHLHMAQMYGVAESVKAIVKSKRLLVKITKKRNRFNLWDKGNLKPWPQLGKKPIGANSGSSDAGGASYIDEDIFKGEMNPAMPGGFDEDLFSKAVGNK